MANFDPVTSVAEPAFNLAAMLGCAHGLAKQMEADSEVIDPQVHALQRMLAMCVDAAHEIGSAGLNLLQQTKGQS
jgi:hypothetical protein